VRGDRVALGIGVTLAALMLAWFGWKLAQTVARDRAVAPGVAPAPAMPGH
jgi:TRAP-type C4-dicarboxylate transport system permease small subunit